jgi:hypothetical protein
MCCSGGMLARSLKLQGVPNGVQHNVDIHVAWCPWVASKDVHEASMSTLESKFISNNSYPSSFVNLSLPFTCRLSPGTLKCATALQAAETSAQGRDVVVSLQYLRDRIGVPRDLPYPAARQLRAHINWYVSEAGV